MSFEKNNIQIKTLISQQQDEKSHGMHEETSSEEFFKYYSSIFECEIGDDVNHVKALDQGQLMF